MILIYTLTLFLNLPFKNNGEQKKMPYFEWSSRTRSFDGIPDLLVIFSNGVKDSIISLKPYHPLELEKTKVETFTFMGTLKSDNSSVVALTGRSFESEYYISIFRAQQTDIFVRVNESGHSFSLKLDDEKITNETIDFLFPPHSMSSTSRTFSLNRAMPKNNYLRLVIGYTASALTHFGNLSKYSVWLSSFMTHLQAIYRHPSLNFTVTFDVPVPLINLSTQTTISEASTRNLNSIKDSTLSHLTSSQNGQHLMVIVKDNTADRTVGIAYMNGICSKTNYAVSIIEIGKTLYQSAKIAAHELAHNFGVDHDVDPCYGIMYYSIGGGNTWSTCSNTDFSDYQSTLLSTKGYWCLDRENPSQVGGSWTPWTPYTSCSKLCGNGLQSRSRTCVGSNCVGNSKMSISCNTQTCSRCSDLINQCKMFKGFGWCSSNVNYMKVYCKQSCNLDSISSVYCAIYKKHGYCQNNKFNYNNMALLCGATCEIFCS